MLAYRNAVVLEDRTKIDWGDGVVSHVGKSLEQLAQWRIEHQITTWADTLYANKVIVFLSEPDTTKDFRRKLLPTYKESRKDKVRPELLMPLKDWLFKQGPWECILLPGVEGDDGMGIWSTNPEVEGEKIIVSIDKDLRQIPGLYYNPYKVPDKVETISQAQADRWWFTQCLTGDSCDGYIGCRGVGPKNAAKILDQAETEAHEISGFPFMHQWQAVVKTFESKGFTEADALVQARVSRILRHGEFNLETGEIALWHPNCK